MFETTKILWRSHFYSKHISFIFYIMHSSDIQTIKLRSSYFLILKILFCFILYYSMSLLIPCRVWQYIVLQLYQAFGGVKVSIVAFQAIDPSSVPGWRYWFFRVKCKTYEVEWSKVLILRLKFYDLNYINYFMYENFNKYKRRGV